MPRRIALTWGLFVAWALAACAVPATPAPTQPLPTVTSAPAMATAVPTEQPPATSQPANPPTPTPSGDVRIFSVLSDQTTASYAVEETFLNDNNRLATAVGKTSQVSGDLALNYAAPSRSTGSFSVDISALTSDSARRDNAIRGRWLESATYPLATFVIRSITDMPANPQEGQPVTFKMQGDMTVRQVTRAVEWDVTATLSGNTLTGAATTFIMMADFGVTPPDIIGVLRVKDGVTLTLNFTMQAR